MAILRDDCDLTAKEHLEERTGKSQEKEKKSQALFSKIVAIFYTSPISCFLWLESVMNDADFRGFLEVCTTLSNSQRDILRSVLCEEPPRQSCQLL